ncbi:DUF4384 domain-containing protein [Pelagicoccus enzymogenes]|uniref:DUF4384 domain-containing protein n=1 Tax=Pelagicoccus enzymogenes TaxID=2773457 RepID=UPI00281020B3|nr:DUF4384 domain-containing protein [Pelagicoccus enzymogenes]MDQ8197009.1 DUF4384 domain-containing protein [Pelagicoccus enzymogenes]
MSSDSGAASSDSTLQLIAKKIRSQFLLFCIAIALVIVTVIQTAGVDAALPIGAILIVFFVGAIVYSFVEKDQGPVARSLDAVPDSKGEELELQVWMKHVDPSKPEHVYRIGDQVRVCVRASRDCYLTLLNLASDGELTILFPNRHNQNNRIQGGITHEIPSDGYGFNIVLEEPVGVDRLKAIATLDPKPLLETQFDPDGEFFHSVPSSATPRAMCVVAASVEKRQDREWAAASTQFEVKKI